MKQIPGTIIAKLKNRHQIHAEYFAVFRMKHPEDKASLAQSVRESFRDDFPFF